MKNSMFRLETDKKSERFAEEFVKLQRRGMFEYK